MEKLCGKKKWQCFLYPEFFWFLFRCTRKQEKYRYSDMSAVQKRIQKLEIRYRTVTWRKRFLEAVAAGVLIGILISDSWITETGRVFCGDLRSNRSVLRSQTVSGRLRRTEKVLYNSGKETAEI